MNFLATVIFPLPMTLEIKPAKEWAHEVCFESLVHLFGVLGPDNQFCIEGREWQMRVCHHEGEHPRTQRLGPIDVSKEKDAILAFLLHKDHMFEVPLEKRERAYQTTLWLKSLK